MLQGRYLLSKWSTKLQPCKKCKRAEHNKLFSFKKLLKPEVYVTQTTVFNSHCNFKIAKHAVLFQTCCGIA